MANFEYSDTLVHKSVALTTHGNEYSLALPEGVKSLEFQCRDGTDIYYSINVAGKVAGPTEPYHTLKSGTVFKQDKLFLQGPQTLYFSCGSDTKVVEVTYGV